MEIDTLSCGAAEIIRRQLDAYNARNIEAFMAYWAPDTEVYAQPDTLITSGAEAIRTRHVERFKEPNLFPRLISRVGVGGLVIDRDQTGRKLFNIKETRLLQYSQPVFAITLSILIWE